MNKNVFFFLKKLFNTLIPCYSKCDSWTCSTTASGNVPETESQPLPIPTESETILPRAQVIQFAVRHVWEVLLSHTALGNRLTQMFRTEIWLYVSRISKNISMFWFRNSIPMYLAQGDNQRNE